MSKRIEQRICIKFCQKLGHSSSETITMIRKVYVESDPCSGRPSSTKTPENVERIRTVINENRRLTVREIGNDLGIPKTIVSEILSKDLGMSRLNSKFVPHRLTDDQKLNRIGHCRDIIRETQRDENFLKTIKGDE
ncbi:Protein GVQW3, partial [Anthophora retusa]